MSDAEIPGEPDDTLEKARDFPADVDYRPTEALDGEEYEPPAAFSSSYDDEVVEDDEDLIEDEEAAREAPGIVEQ